MGSNHQRLSHQPKYGKISSAVSRRFAHLAGAGIDRATAKRERAGAGTLGRALGNGLNQADAALVQAMERHVAGQKENRADVATDTADGRLVAAMRRLVAQA